MAQNPWEAFGLIHTTRDGIPVLTESAFWQLSGKHPDAVERVSATETYVHLDQPYRLVKLADRSYCELHPAPGRPRPSRSASAAA